MSFERKMRIGSNRPDKYNPEKNPPLTFAYDMESGDGYFLRPKDGCVVLDEKKHSMGVLDLHKNDVAMVEFGYVDEAKKFLHEIEKITLIRRGDTDDDRSAIVKQAMEMATDEELLEELAVRMRRKD